MKRVSAYITALSGSLLVCATLGLLAVLITFFAGSAVEELLESFGVLSQGWGDTHLSIMIGVAMLVTLPLIIIMFVRSWKSILAVELLP